jgi:hypothetical protein
MYDYIDTTDKALWDDIKERKVLDDDLKKRLGKLIEGFNKKFVP